MLAMENQPASSSAASVSTGEFQKVGCNEASLNPQRCPRKYLPLELSKTHQCLLERKETLTSRILRQRRQLLALRIRRPSSTQRHLVLERPKRDWNQAILAMLKELLFLRSLSIKIPLWQIVHGETVEMSPMTKREMTCKDRKIDGIREKALLLL